MAVYGFMVPHIVVCAAAFNMYQQCCSLTNAACYCPNPFCSNLHYVKLPLSWWSNAWIIPCYWPFFYWTHSLDRFGIRGLRIPGRGDFTTIKQSLSSLISRYSQVGGTHGRNVNLIACGESSEEVVPTVSCSFELLWLYDHNGFNDLCVVCYMIWVKLNSYEYSEKGMHNS